MKIGIERAEQYVVNMWTRMPFRYGIATLTALPHLFVRLTVTIDGHSHVGLAADGLPPKWFTKDAKAPVHREIEEMVEVIRTACRLGTQVRDAPSVFALWERVYEAQEAWAQSTNHPPLLWAFGVSLVERAAIDAFCSAQKMNFSQAVRKNALGIRLAAIHAELDSSEPRQWLPAAPNRRLAVRHTVGLADPMTEGDIPDSEKLDDRLPQSLESCIDQYKLNHFKIKIPAQVDEAVDRIARVAELVERRCPRFAFTADGNEFFDEVDRFREYWEAVRSHPRVRSFIERGLIFVEQPIHRDEALGDDVARAMQHWTERPPIIIDESDGSIDSLRLALECGYAGTSHKNCKGVFKGIANACLIEQRRRADRGSCYVMSGEDLANVGPVALLQDLAVAGTLGLEHVERNGHHYFAGLSAFPDDVQQEVLKRHGDLYRQHDAGEKTFPTLAVTQGAIDLGSVIDAPFGYAVDLDVTRYAPIEKWQVESLNP